jgi:N utilization substance protein B
VTASRTRGSVSKRRRNARQKAMQAMYQWDFDNGEQSAWTIFSQFRDLQNMDWVDVDYFQELFFYSVEHCADIDAKLEDCLDRPMTRVDPVERGVLRVACAEMLSRLDIPYRVIVTEALEITKLFGSDQGHRYVNGVLDKLARSVRSIEHQMHSKDAD